MSAHETCGAPHPERGRQEICKQPVGHDGPHETDHQSPHYGRAMWIPRVGR